MDVTQALRSSDYQQQLRAIDQIMTGNHVQEFGSGIPTHKSPVANTPTIKIFFLMGICNFQRHGIGSIRIAKSDTTLKIPELSASVLLL